MIDRLTKKLRDVFPDTQGFFRGISSTCVPLCRRSRSAQLCSKLRHNPNPAPSPDREKHKTNEPVITVSHSL